MYKPENDPGFAEGLRTMRDVYLAGPFFNDAQVAEIQSVEEMLKEAGFTFFSPRLECRYKPGDDPIVADRAFWLNIYHVTTCKFVMACLSWPDVGTGWELGYAHAKGTPRLGFTSNPKVGANLMAVKTVNGLVPISHLHSALSVLHLDIFTRSRNVVAAIQGVDHSESWHGEIE